MYVLIISTPNCCIWLSPFCLIYACHSRSAGGFQTFQYQMSPYHHFLWCPHPYSCHPGTPVGQASHLVTLRMSLSFSPLLAWTVFASSDVQLVPVSVAQACLYLSIEKNTFPKCQALFCSLNCSITTGQYLHMSVMLALPNACALCPKVAPYPVAPSITWD